MSEKEVRASEHGRLFQEVPKSIVSGTQRRGCRR